MSIQDETFDRISKAIEAGQLDDSNAKPFIDQILLPDLRQRLMASGLAHQIADVEASLEGRILAEATVAARDDRIHRSITLEAALHAMKDRSPI